MYISLLLLPADRLGCKSGNLRPGRATCRLKLRRTSRLFSACPIFISSSDESTPRTSSQRHSRRVAVIGAGVGGIATAALLAKSGLQVTIFEKNKEPGGRLHRVVDRSQCRHDTGPSLFLMPQAYQRLFEDLGEDLASHLELRRVDPAYQVVFRDSSQSRLVLSSDLNRMKFQLESIEPGSFEKYLQYLADGDFNFREGLKHFIQKNFNSPLDYLSDPLSKVPLAFRMKPFANHFADLGNYFSDERIKAALSFQNLYLGLSPYEAPAIFSLLQYTELVDGVWYPVGGMYTIIESLVSIAKRLGVEFRLDAPVKAINVDSTHKHRRATGITLESGETWDADDVVTNADLPYAYSNLLPRDQDIQQRARQISAMRHTSSVISFYWGLNKSYPQLLHHNIFLGKDQPGAWAEVFGTKGMTPTEIRLTDPNFYVHAPSRTDPTACPPGYDSVMALVPVPHITPDFPQDYEAATKRARRAVFTRFSEIGMPDFADHVRSETVYTPPAWQEHYNLSKGAVFGLSHGLFQLGYFRPPNKERKVDNLYFVGASTHPGNGVPLVLISSQLVAQRILADARSYK